MRQCLLLLLILAAIRADPVILAAEDGRLPWPKAAVT
jgi:hypothetical protein